MIDPTSINRLPKPRSDEKVIDCWRRAGALGLVELIQLTIVLGGVTPLPLNILPDAASTAWARNASFSELRRCPGIS